MLWSQLVPAFDSIDLFFLVATTFRCAVDMGFGICLVKSLAKFGKQNLNGAWGVIL